MHFRSPQTFTIFTRRKVRWNWTSIVDSVCTVSVSDTCAPKHMTYVTWPSRQTWQNVTGGRSQHHVRNAPTGPAKVPPARDVYVEHTPMLDYVTILEAGKAILDFVFEPSQQTKQKSNPGNRPMQQCNSARGNSKHPWTEQAKVPSRASPPLPFSPCRPCVFPFLFAARLFSPFSWFCPICHFARQENIYTIIIIP